MTHLKTFTSFFFCTPWTLHFTLFVKGQGILRKISFSDCRFLTDEDFLNSGPFLWSSSAAGAIWCFYLVDYCIPSLITLNTRANDTFGLNGLNVLNENQQYSASQEQESGRHGSSLSRKKKLPRQIMHWVSFDKWCRPILKDGKMMTKALCASGNGSVWCIWVCGFTCYFSGILSHSLNVT